MRHYVLTRSAYGPAWDLEANRRRLAVTRGVTARLMGLQTSHAWTWIVALDPRDPLLAERRAVFQAAAPEFVEVPWQAPPVTRSQAAYLAYRAPWADAIGERDEVILQTRLDDDDGLMPTALARYRAATRRTGGVDYILMLPRGVRIWQGRYSDVVHNNNAMHTLVTMPGSARIVYDYGHATCRRSAPVLTVDRHWGWLWARHPDTISGHHSADRLVSERVRKVFPIDWSVLE